MNCEDSPLIGMRQVTTFAESLTIPCKSFIIIE